MPELMDQSGTWVQFRIRDIYVPEPAAVLEELHGEDVLEGRIIALSEAPEPNEMYAIIEVFGLQRPLIVPAGSLSVVSAAQ
jgi:hypothetical protein